MRTASWTKEELKAILQAIPSKRNRLMVLVAFCHALRVSEVIELTGADIADGFVDVRRKKGSLRTVQPWVKSDDPDLSEFEGLLELPKTVRRDEMLFPMTRFGADKLIRRAAKKAGLPAHLAHFHCAKHTRAMLSIKTAGIENVRVYLGHKSIASTGAYLKVTDAQAAQAMAI
jgi:integrase